MARRSDGGRRLEALLEGATQRSPASVALVRGAERVSYGTLAGRVHQCAWALQRRGIVRGDRVLIHAGNTIDALVAFWGALEASAVPVPVHPQTKPDRLRWLLMHCRAAALVTEHRLLPVFTPATQDLLGLLAVLVSGGAAAAEAPPVDAATADPSAVAGRAVDFAEALGAETVDRPPPPLGDQRDLAAVLYTSGSTGRPKGVMLTHENMLSATESIVQYLGLAEEDVIQVLSPLAFDYGLYQSLLATHQGARLVLAPPALLPGQVLKQAADEGVTFFPGVPTTFSLLGELRDLSAWDLSRVRAVTSTAATLTDRHVATIRRVFPEARIFSMYGITECKRCSYLPPEDLDRKPGSVGIAIPNTELWLVDDAGRRLGPHKVGQIVIRGPTVMRGYWDDHEETARMLRPGPEPGETVLYTGDLGRLDDEGYLYFVGRTDDIIKSRGQKVPPREVELALAAIAGVKEAAVIGVPDEIAGQAVMAFVVAEDGIALEEAALLRCCRERLEGVMVPRAIVVVSALPRNPNGKIDKLALMQPTAEPAAPPVAARRPMSNGA